MKGGGERLTVMLHDSQGEGSRKTEMWANYLIHCWECASPQKYLRFRMGNVGVERDYFRRLFVMPACISGQSKGLQSCKYITMSELGGAGGRRRRRIEWEEEQEQGSSFSQGREK